MLCCRHGPQAGVPPRHSPQSGGPVKSLWDEGKFAIVNGVGYTMPNRSHFRSMNILHNGETVEIAPDGVLGDTAKRVDKTPVKVLPM